MLDAPTWTSLATPTVNRRRSALIEVLFTRGWAEKDWVVRC
jgi:hypothetical protein